MYWLQYIDMACVTDVNCMDIFLWYVQCQSNVNTLGLSLKIYDACTIIKITIMSD